MEEFVARYAMQLRHFGVPEALWPQLREKLSGLDKLNEEADDASCPAGLWKVERLGAGEAQVVSQAHMACHAHVFIIKHSLAEASGWKLLKRLEDDFPLLLRVAEELQVLGDEEEEQEQEQQQQPEVACSAGAAALASAAPELPHPAVAQLGPRSSWLQPDSPVCGSDSSPAGSLLQVPSDAPPQPQQALKLPQQLPLGGRLSSINHQAPASAAPVEESLSAHETVLRAVRGHLHKAVFMCEVPDGRGGNMRLRYMMAPPLSLMAPAPDPHVHVCPFLVLPSTEEERALSSSSASCSSSRTEGHVVSLAWPARDIPAGARLTRCRLPLGLADYSSQAFWQAVYQGASEEEEWYVDQIPEEVWDLAAPHATPSSSSSKALRTEGAMEVLTNSQLGAAPQQQQQQQQQQQEREEEEGYVGTALVAGCGNSTLGVDLLRRRGWGRVLNVDNVPEVVRLMAERHPPAAHPGLAWEHGDLTHLPTVPDGSVDLVVDKATLDGMCTAEASSSQRWAGGGAAPMLLQEPGARSSVVSGYLREMLRVVRRPHGCLLVITLRGPEAFRKLLADAEAGAPLATCWWRVQHHVPLSSDASSAHCYACRPHSSMPVGTPSLPVSNAA